MFNLAESEPEVVMAARNLSILSRQFSTSTSKAALVKTPIPVYGIEGRYSAALFSAANKKKALDTVEGDLVSYSLEKQRILNNPENTTNCCICSKTGPYTNIVYRKS